MPIGDPRRAPAWRTILLVLVIVTALAGMAVLGFLWATAPALGHESWISQRHHVDPETKRWCCNEHDCSPVPGERVGFRPGGYFIRDTGETIPQSRALPSEDGQYWRCRMEAADPLSETRCFFAPVPGS